MENEYTRYKDTTFALFLAHYMPSDPNNAEYFAEELFEGGYELEGNDEYEVEDKIRSDGEYYSKEILEDFDAWLQDGHLWPFYMTVVDDGNRQDFQKTVAALKTFREHPERLAKWIARGIFNHVDIDEYLQDKEEREYGDYIDGLIKRAEEEGHY